MKRRGVVLDAGTGNVRSAVRALERAGADVRLTAEAEAVMDADGLVVPGVGAFGTVMDKLRAVGADRLIERRLAGGLPVLGICVGLQVLFESSRERGHHEGLGQWPGTVERLDAPVVPHMGWSRVEAAEGSRLFAGVEGERFYFVHSYGVPSDPSERLDGRGDPPLVTWARHGTRFVAAVEDGPLSATQFHPEKSSDAGARLLGNWLSTLPTTHRRHQHDRHP